MRVLRKVLYSLIILSILLAVLSGEVVKQKLKPKQKEGEEGEEGEDEKDKKDEEDEKEEEFYIWNSEQPPND